MSTSTLVQSVLDALVGTLSFNRAGHPEPLKQRT